MKLLIVEDDSGVHRAFKSLLRDLEMEIVHAESWAAMREEMQKQKFDVILLDLGLPDSSTNDTLSKINDLKMSSPATAICVITGHPGQTRESALEAGADDFLHKSNAMKSGTLIQLVANLLSKSGANKVDCQMQIATKATHTVIEQMKYDGPC